MMKRIKFIFSSILLIIAVFHIPNVFAQWHVVNKLNNGYEIQSVNEHYTVNSDGNYVVKVKRYFPSNRNAPSYQGGDNVTNINTFEIHHNLKNYRCIGDEWFDTNNNRTSFDDYSYPNSRDYNNGWKPMNLYQHGAWSNIWRFVIAVIETIKPRSTSKVPQADNSAVYTKNKVDQGAEYPGGTTALSRFISSNMKYPEEAYKNNIQGRVVLRLLIEQDGCISDITVNKSIHPLLDKEALRVAKKMQRFKPAVKNGVPVRSYFNLPMSFKLAN
ncbi:MAG: energy transducer TonB [Muribaculaceae bacterium]|nr:energy transducer TonB [Muribaculaceae bacterium]